MVEDLPTPNDKIGEAPRERHVEEPPQAEAFLTASDVMNSLNQALSDLSGNDQVAEPPHFELQRRLPDGSTRKATPQEQAANDCNTQIQQAAQLLSELKSDQERLAWAEAQRMFGNQVYEKKMYEKAIDVYLTCLPAVASEEKAVSSESDHSASNDNNVRLQQERLLLFLKIMNNLSQSTLQLGWYRKTEHFGILAFEHLAKHENKIAGMDAAMLAIFREQRSKLYFRRGKARRLRGDYTLALSDLKDAQKDLEEETGNSPAKLRQQRAAVKKELGLLEKSKSEGRKNERRQKKALQQVMMPTTNQSTPVRSSVETKTSTVKQEATPTGVFASNAKPRRRPYSTLRAPSAKQEPRVVKQEPVQPTAWQYYVSMIGRVAEKLLELLGDDEDDDESERLNTQRQQQPKED